VETFIELRFGKDRVTKMIEMEFIGGPLDGTQEMKPEEIRPAISVPAQIHGYYQLCKRTDEEERPLVILHLSAEEIGKRYRYLWVTRESRGKTADVT
jgi:hypothetical protein